MEEWQISLARSAAGAGGHDNPTFHVGDVTDLPFEDDSFDAAHWHAVLMHVLDTQAVLAEVKRILKSGGIISSREMTVAFSFLEPLLGSTEAAWDTFSEPYRSQWRPPSNGEGTENTFLGAGFSDIRASASFDFFSTTEDIAFLHTFISDWFYSPDVIAGGVFQQDGEDSAQPVLGVGRRFDGDADEPQLRLVPGGPPPPLRLVLCSCIFHVAWSQRSLRGPLASLYGCSAGRRR